MVTILHRTFLFATLSLFAAVPALRASTWTQPTPEQLKMTSDPAAPDAPAVYLFREEIVDDNVHFHRVYAQIKILTEKGKEEFSDIEIPYEGSNSDIKAVEGRTIHADGTVIPFTGKPYSKELVKSGDVKWMAKVFSMPDVQVGSILEYRWELQYGDNWYIPPHFYLQQSVFTHKAHYHFIPLNMATTSKILTTKDAFGKENVASRLLYYPNLPTGVKVRAGMDGYDLRGGECSRRLPRKNSRPRWIAMPTSCSSTIRRPRRAGISGKRRVRSGRRMWTASPIPRTRSGRRWRGSWGPGDSDDQKLRKIYAAVMTVENTRSHARALRRGEQGRGAAGENGGGYMGAEAGKRR